MKSQSKPCNRDHEATKTVIYYVLYRKNQKLDRNHLAKSKIDNNNHHHHSDHHYNHHHTRNNDDNNIQLFGLQTNQLEWLMQYKVINPVQYHCTLPIHIKQDPMFLDSMQHNHHTLNAISTSTRTKLFLPMDKQAGENTPGFLLKKIIALLVNAEILNLIKCRDSSSNKNFKSTQTEQQKRPFGRRPS